MSGSRWTTVDQGEGQITVYVQDPQLGRTNVGTLYLNETDAADLADRLEGDEDR